MNKLAKFGSTVLPQALRAKRGSMAIETAFVAPVLVLLSLGGFQASQVVARQTEIQTAAAEAAEIALASPTTSLTTLRDIIKTSTGITNNSQVLVTNEYRCGTTATRQASNACGSGVTVTTYDKIVVTDTYTPKWTAYGIGSPISYSVTRWVIVG